MNIAKSRLGMAAAEAPLNVGVDRFRADEQYAASGTLSGYLVAAAPAIFTGMTPVLPIRASLPLRRALTIRMPISGCWAARRMAATGCSNCLLPGCICSIAAARN